jgi:hypothetical protein
MTLSIFVKGKINFRHIQISKENLTSSISKYNFKYVCQRKSLTLDMSKYASMNLSMFVKGKFDFRHVQIWLWVCLSKEKLNLDMSKLNIFIKKKLTLNTSILFWVYLSKKKLILDISKYDFEHVC